MSKTHWKQMVNLDYIGAYALTDGKDLTLTIDHVVRENVTGNNGKKEQCMVLYFKERDYKPMILNRTNAKSITTLVGSPYIEDWTGHRVTLYATTTRLGGDVVECLRIRPTVTETTAPIHCDICGTVIEPAFGLTAEQLVTNTKKRFGKSLCADCAQTEADKAKADKAEKGGDK